MHSERLHRLQKLVVGFIWGRREAQGRHRIVARIICLPCKEGGLGLINIATQAQALVMRIFMWGLEVGHHPLQWWIRAQLSKRVEELFGFPSLACLLVAKNTRPEHYSLVLSNMLNVWHLFTKEVTLRLPTCEDYMVAPIWGDSQFTTHGTPLKAFSNTLRALIEAGHTQLGDLWDSLLGTWKVSANLLPNANLWICNGVRALLRQILPPTLYYEEEFMFFRATRGEEELIVEIEGELPHRTFSVVTVEQGRLKPTATFLGVIERDRPMAVRLIIRNQQRLLSMTTL